MLFSLYVVFETHTHAHSRKINGQIECVTGAQAWVRIRQNLIVCALKSFSFKTLPVPSMSLKMNLHSLDEQKEFHCNLCVYNLQLHISSPIFFLFRFFSCCCFLLLLLFLSNFTCMHFGYLIFCFVFVFLFWLCVLFVATKDWMHNILKPFPNNKDTLIIVQVGFLCCCHIFHAIFSN